MFLFGTPCSTETEHNRLMAWVSGEFIGVLVWYDECSIDWRMTITINYRPKASPGYVPRKALTLHNVSGVHSSDVNRIEVTMMFTDHRPTHDHVVSVVVIPERS